MSRTKAGDGRMSGLCRGVAAMAICVASVRALQAQERAPVVHLRGIAYDSLRSRPLPGALVTIEALGRATISDSVGAFAFDSLPHGTYDFILQHAYLDSLGLGEPRASIEVPGSGRPVRVATPSFTTVWRRVCGTRPPNDSGFVHGIVRDARSGEPVASAEVQASWLKVGFDRRSGVSQERLGGRVTTDGRGRYVMCGVPNEMQLSVWARVGEARTDLVELFHVEPGVTRRDFLLPALGDSALRSVARGVVRGAAGGPVPNALVQAGGARDTRTDTEGRFLLSSIPIGTRTIVVRSIGAEPMRAIADVSWGDTAYVEITLRNVATLAQVDVVGSAVQRRFLEELAERQERGIAKFMDSTLVNRMNNVHSVLTARTMARVNRDGSVSFPGPCSPVVWIDKRYVQPQDVGLELRLLNPMRIGALEVYERSTGIPFEFYAPTNRPTLCAIVIWTTAMFP